MVCDRCKAAVAGVFSKHAISVKQIELGEVIVGDSLGKEKILALKKTLNELGFELIDDKKSRTIEQIKTEVIAHVQLSDYKTKKKFSHYLSQKIGKDYSSLSSLFSEVEGTTLEQYIIHQKIEKAKELLVYDELSLGQIADQLSYSSIQHLSNQFKKVTGLSPSHFKKMRHPSRKPLDKV
jgi:AraC-like DNA-binding protein